MWKKKCKDIWRKDHRNITFWVQMMSQKENDTEDVHMHVHSSQMIKAVCKNDIVRFNPTKCNGKVGYIGCIIQVSLLGRVEHLAGLFFVQRKETYIKEICFSFYWNTHIQGTTRSKQVAKLMLTSFCAGFLWKLSLIFKFSSLVFCSSTTAFLTASKLGLH